MIEPERINIFITDIQSWSNDNSGLLALLSLLLFISTSALSIGYCFLKRNYAKRISKPKLTLDIIETPTMCSSFPAKTDDLKGEIHRTAFLIYLKITNNSEVPIQIGYIHIGYKSEASENPDEWYWLKNESHLLEDFTMPISDQIKIYPFLKQSNTLMKHNVSTYLRPGEDTNGLVYFEQDNSSGDYYPHMDPDFKVQTLIVVHDSKGNKWSIEHRVTKTQIKYIREICPSFGLSKANTLE